jgi:chromosome segregation protein
MNKFYETQNEKKDLELELNKVTKQKDKLKMTIDEMEAKNKINNSELNKKQNELKDLEIKVSKMDVKLDYYLNTLSNDYEITFEKAKERYPLEIDPDEARTKVNTYKANIKRIGMVSLESIEEYDRVRERYEFLSGQRNDLLNAKETLLENLNMYLKNYLVEVKLHLNLLILMIYLKLV